MNPPSRFEIEKFANERFQADRERRIERYAQEQNQALAQVRSGGNIGGCLPALIHCKQERLRTEILILADAWVEASTLYVVPLQEWAEKALEKAATPMAAGTISSLRGQLDLEATRTQRPQLRNAGGSREIDSAIEIGIARRETQAEDAREQSCAFAKGRSGGFQQAVRTNQRRWIGATR